MICEFEAFVIKVEAASHPAAVKSCVISDLIQVSEDRIMFAVIQVFRCRRCVVKAELYRNAESNPAVKIFRKTFSRIVFVQNTVDAVRALQFSQI